MFANTLFNLAVIVPAICVGPGLAIRALGDDKAADPSVPRELAEAIAKGEPIIEAQDTVEIPPGRPEWIGSEPRLKGKTHAIAVSSGPYATPAQAKRSLDEALVKATNEYIADQLGSELAPQLLRYDARTIRQRFVKDE